MLRRHFLATAAIPLLAQEREPARTVPAYEQPLFNLHKQFTTPVKIASIEYLRQGRNTFVRATSSDGVAGIVRTKEIDDFTPILIRRVFPFFTGKDARDLESLVDLIYIQHYKIAGQPFWSPVAAAEQAIWDMLGRTAKKPVCELIGGIKRKQIPVYLSGSGRETTAEQEVDVYVRGVKETGTKAVKFKVGGRMSRNADAYPGRTKTMVTLARKLLGDDVVLYADANGSYDSKLGVEVAHMLEDLGFKFFEEPCPWEEVSETKKVADAIKMSIAGGEQDSSLWKFQDMIERRVIDIVQPDLNYCGGIIRAARVARMARAAKMTIVPHNTQIDSAGCKILQFAAAIDNIGPHMEFPHRGNEKYDSWYTPHFKIQNGHIAVPLTPGLGVDFDPAFIAKAEKVTA